MKLSSKGVIKPPPRLSVPAQKLSETIQSWPGIVAATHWYLYDRSVVDGVDFYVCEEELGHIHLDGEIHLRLTKGLREQLIDAGRAQAFPYAEDWVQAPVTSAAQVRHAEWLFRLGYDRLNGAPLPGLRARIASGPPNKR